MEVTKTAALDAGSAAGRARRDGTYDVALRSPRRTWSIALTLVVVALAAATASRS